MVEKYEFTPEMGEISGFGGNYEKGCKQMLQAGLKWLDEHPKADPQFKGYKNVYGVITADNKDAKALSKIVTEAPDPNEGVTGAMHQAVIESILWIKANGWEAYVKKMSEKEPKVEPEPKKDKADARARRNELKDEMERVMIENSIEWITRFLDTKDKQATALENIANCLQADQKRQNTTGTKRIQIGSVGIDSGSVLLIDPCYLTEYERISRPITPALENFLEQWKSSDNAYDQIYYPHEEPGLGVISRTGAGDGYYPVYAHVMEDGFISKIEIDFEPKEHKPSGLGGKGTGIQVDPEDPEYKTPEDPHDQ